MKIPDPRNFFLDAVEARMNPADALVERTKKQLKTRDNKRKATRANQIVDQVFYAAKDESPEDEAERKKAEIGKMLGRDSGKGGITDEDMEAALQAIEYRRNTKPRGADVEAAMQMDSERRKGAAAAEMEDGDDEYSPVSAVTKADLERGKPLEVQGGMRRVVAETEKGTGKMLTKKPEGDLGDRTGFQPKAKLVAEDELMQSFFAKAHGGSFDPNSRVDKAKMQKILDMVNSDPKLMSLTPGKFAVKLYASK
jgi:hypothetical protein